MSIIEQITQRIKEQPLPSMVAFEILKTVEDEDHSMKDVVRLLWSARLPSAAKR